MKKTYSEFDAREVICRYTQVCKCICKCFFPTPNVTLERLVLCRAIVPLHNQNHMNMKNVRVTFRVETELSGKSLAEIKSKFESLEIDFPLGIHFVELVSVENSETYDDLLPDWNNDAPLTELIGDVMEWFDEYDSDVVSIGDFQIKHDGALITHIAREGGELSLWSGDPEVDKHAEQLVIDDEEVYRDICMAILYGFRGW